MEATPTVVPLHPLTDSQALSWLRERRKLNVSKTALGKAWGWPEHKVRRRLAQWKTDGLIRCRKKTISTVENAVGFPVEKPVASVPNLAPEMPPTPVSTPTPESTPEPTQKAVDAPSRSRVGDTAAYATAVSLTAVAGYFSITGMIELFPGAPVAVMVLGSTMEVAKLIIAGWLASNWRTTGRLLRSVLVTLVVGLAVINATGVYGRLVEVHLGTQVAASSSVLERISGLDARIAEQVHVVTDIDARVSQIDGIILEMTKRGRTASAIEAIGTQRKTRDGLVASRQQASDVLVNLRTERAKLDGARQRVEASIGPVQYLAKMVGTDTETAIRWLILLMVLTCDPAAIALTIAASRRKP
jgi:hypothetical protein